MKYLKFLFCFLIFLSCQNDNSIKKEKPFVFSIEEFDLEKNQMKINLEITNTSNKTLNEGTANTIKIKQGTKVQITSINVL